MNRIEYQALTERPIKEKDDSEFTIRRCLLVSRGYLGNTNLKQTVVYLSTNNENQTGFKRLKISCKS